MSKFIPKKLNVEFKDTISIKEPIIPRKYTLTHSDETGDLFLTIGDEYDYEKINPLRDEALGSWIKEKDEYVFEVVVEVDAGKEFSKAVIRDRIFRDEIPLALKAMIYGDEIFFNTHKELNDSKIRVYFKSKYPEFNLVEIWGKIREYKIEDSLAKRVNIPMPITIPILMQNDNSNKNNNRIISKALLAMLNPYIKIEVYILFGKNTPYCLNKAEILKSEVVKRYGACNEAFEITVGLSAGKKAPPYNNMIITFLITEEIVKVLKVKNPK